MRSVERRYDARITEVYFDGALAASPAPAEQNRFQYSAVAVNTEDRVKMTNVAPFRRWVFATSQQPEVLPASVGDDCEIAMCQGVARLVDVPEQYLVSDCET